MSLDDRVNPRWMVAPPRQVIAPSLRGRAAVAGDLRFVVADREHGPNEESAEPHEARASLSAAGTPSPSGLGLHPRDLHGST
jgi:hypothetical protein